MYLLLSCFLKLTGRESTHPHITHEESCRLCKIFSQEMAEGGWRAERGKRGRELTKSRNTGSSSR